MTTATADTSAISPERMERIRKAVELKRAGKTFRAISEELGKSIGQIQRDLADAAALGLIADTPGEAEDTAADGPVIVAGGSRTLPPAEEQATGVKVTRLDGYGRPLPATAPAKPTPPAADPSIEAREPGGWASKLQLIVSPLGIVRATVEASRTCLDAAQVEALAAERIDARVRARVREALPTLEAHRRERDLQPQHADVARRIRLAGAEARELEARREALTLASPVPDGLGAKLADLDGQIAEAKERQNGAERELQALSPLLLDAGSRAGQERQQTIGAALELAGKALAEDVAQAEKEALDAVKRHVEPALERLAVLRAVERSAKGAEGYGRAELVAKSLLS